MRWMRFYEVQVDGQFRSQATVLQRKVPGGGGRKLDAEGKSHRMRKGVRMRICDCMLNDVASKNVEE